MLLVSGQTDCTELVREHSRRLNVRKAILPSPLTLYPIPGDKLQPYPCKLTLEGLSQNQRLIMSDKELPVVETENRITQDTRGRRSRQDQRQSRIKTEECGGEGSMSMREREQEQRGKGSYGAGGREGLKCTGQYISDGSEGD